MDHIQKLNVFSIFWRSTFFPGVIHIFFLAFSSKKCRIFVDHCQKLNVFFQFFWRSTKNLHFFEENAKKNMWITPGKNVDHQNIEKNIDFLNMIQHFFEENAKKNVDHICRIFVDQKCWFFHSKKKCGSKNAEAELRTRV